MGGRKRRYDRYGRYRYEHGHDTLSARLNRAVYHVRNWWHTWKGVVLTVIYVLVAIGAVLYVVDFVDEIGKTRV